MTAHVAGGRRVDGADDPHPIQAAIIHLGPDNLVFVNSVKLLKVRIKGA